MAISKIKLPDNSVQDIHDSRVPLAAWFNQANTTMYWFASAADKASFIADQTQTSLVLFSTFVDLVLKRIILTDSVGETTKSTTEDQTTLSITVDFVEQEKPIAGGSWEDNDEGAIDLTVYVDTGNTGTYTQLGTTQHFVGPDDYTINVRNSLVLGTNKVKIECVANTDSTIASSIEYTVILQDEAYIVFADPNLEAFCANQWGDGIGLKPSQAAAVTGTMTRGLFDGSYTSFDEFRYFGFTAMETYSFRSTTIKSIIIPSGITEISNWSFYQSQLESVTLPDTLTTIQVHAFRNAKLKSVTIPASVTYIGDTAFYSNGNQFTTAVLLPTTPPTCDSSKIFADNANLKIYVPYSSDHSILDAYKASWTALTSKIYELNPDGTIPT